MLLKPCNLSCVTAPLFWSSPALAGLTHLAGAGRPRQYFLKGAGVVLQAAGHVYARRVHRDRLPPLHAARLQRLSAQKGRPISTKGTT